MFWRRIVSSLQSLWCQSTYRIFAKCLWWRCCVFKRRLLWGCCFNCLWNSPQEAVSCSTISFPLRSRPTITLFIFRRRCRFNLFENLQHSSGHGSENISQKQKFILFWTSAKCSGSKVSDTYYVKMCDCIRNLERKERDDLVVGCRGPRQDS